MRQAVIHIGLPRTGTTSLQRVLSELRPRLLAAGVLYPDLTPRTATTAHLSHQHLGHALAGRSHDQAELLQGLDDQLAATDAELVVLSYEALCLIPARRNAPAVLAKLLANRGFAGSVLATIKPQAEFLNSSYTWRMQFLREVRSFPAYAANEARSMQLDFGALFEPWRVAFDGRLTVVPLRDRLSAEEPFLPRVLNELGVLPRMPAGITPDDLAVVENRSPGPVAVEAARRLRLRGAHLALGSRAREATRFIEDRARARSLDAAPFNGLDPAIRDAIEERWQRANERLAQQCWGSSFDVRVARAPMREVNEIGRCVETGQSDHAQALADAACSAFGVPTTRLRMAAERLLWAAGGFRHRA